MCGNNSSACVPFQDDPLIFDNVYVQTALIMLYSIIFLICFVGNLAVVVVVTAKWKMRSATQFCLGNLAIADLTVALFCIYQNLSTYLLEGWYFGEFMCKMYHFINSLCHTASILILVVIAVERYAALVYPFMSRQLLTRRGLVLIVVTVWLLSAGISVPRLFYFGITHIAITDEKIEHICVPKKSLFNSAAADTIYFIVLYIIPLGIITILYARIAFHLRESERTRNGQLCPEWNNMARVMVSAVQAHLRKGQQRSVAADGVNEDREEVDGEMKIGGSDTPASEFSYSSGFPMGDHRATPYAVQRMGAEECISIEQVPLRSSPLRLISTAKRPAFSDGCVPTSRKKSLDILCDPATNVTDGGRPFYGNPFGIQRKLGHTVYQFCYKIHCSSNQNFRFRIPKREAGDVSTSPAAFATPSSGVTRMGDSQRLFYHYNLLRLRKIRSEQRNSVMRVLIYIVIAFAVLNLPYHVRKLCIHYWPSFDMVSDTSTLLAPLTFLLMYANCALNPILYAFMSSNFRKSLRELFRQCHHRRIQGRK